MGIKVTKQLKKRRNVNCVKSWTYMYMYVCSTGTGSTHPEYTLCTYMTCTRTPTYYIHDIMTYMIIYKECTTCHVCTLGLGLDSWYRYQKDKIRKTCRKFKQNKRKRHRSGEQIGGCAIHEYLKKQTVSVDYLYPYTWTFKRLFNQFGVCGASGASSTQLSRNRTCFRRFPTFVTVHFLLQL